MRTLIVLALVVLALVATTASAQSSCNGGDMDQCYKSIHNGGSCIYDGGKCIIDPCLTIVDKDICINDVRCAYTPWYPSACSARQSLCTSIKSADACSANPLCTMSGTNCVYSVPTSYLTALPKESECPGFPTWSIALVVVWILMIVIFVIIILLVRKKPARNSVEQSNISVESVGNKDAFTTELDEPFH